MDPRTAYQRCHELRYDQFSSVQGLLDAMRDYQRLAPQKLRDETLESILWNKVPIELQQEVRKIMNGSVQELLQNLLRAELVIVQELRSGRNQVNERPQTSATKDVITTNTISRRSQPTAFRGEASRQNIKCFNCRRKGHMAANCPDPPRKNTVETV